MDQIRLWFDQENERWTKILSSPQEIERTVSHRMDSDRLVFSPQLNRFQMEALRNAQTADAIRLQQSYQSIRNLEMAIAAKRKFLTTKRNGNLVLRFPNDPSRAMIGEGGFPKNPKMHPCGVVLSRL